MEKNSLKQVLILIVSMVFMFIFQPLVIQSVDTSQYPRYPENLKPLDVEHLFNFCPNSIYHTNVDGLNYLIDLTGPEEEGFPDGRFSCQVWSKTQIDLSEPFILEFYGYFGDTKKPGTVADGLALTFRNGGERHAGYRGAGMGVYGDGGKQGTWQTDRLGKAHTLEFDTYYNTIGNHHSGVGDHDADLTNLRTQDKRNHVGHIAFRTSGTDCRLSKHVVLKEGAANNPIANGTWRKIFYCWDPKGNNGSGVITFKLDNEAPVKSNHNIRTDLEDCQNVYWGLTASTSPTSAFGGVSQGVVFEDVFFGDRQFQIKKVNSAGIALLGAIFDIKDNDQNVIHEGLTTDANGEITVDLPIGRYTLIETRPPDGYKLSDKEWKIEVDEGGNCKIDDEEIMLNNGICFLEIVNELNPYELILKKETAEGEDLAGAQFKLTSEDGTYEKELPENPEEETAIFTFEDLKIGTYLLEELKAPKGYEKNDTPINMTIHPDGTVEMGVKEFTVELGEKNEVNKIQASIDNHLKPYTLTFCKEDSERNALKGAVFQLKKTDSSEGDYDVTLPKNDSEEALACFKFESVPRGEYELIEKSAPTGYQKLKEPYSIKILENGNITINEEKFEGTLNEEEDLNTFKFPDSIKNQLKMFDFKLNKQDENGAALKGAQFRLKNDESGAEQLIPSDKDSPTATFYFKHLSPGNYQLEEIEAPNGYTKLSKPLTLTIKSNGDVTLDDQPLGIELKEDETNNLIEYSLKNERLKSELVFIKVNERDEPLEGVEFDLYGCSNSESDHQHAEFEKEAVLDCWQLIERAVSQTKGEVRFEAVTKGTYYLVERKTKTGYLLPVGFWEIDLTPAADNKMEEMSITGYGAVLPPAFKAGDEDELLRLPNYVIPVLPAAGTNRLLIQITLGICLIGTGIMLRIWSLFSKGTEQAK